MFGITIDRAAERPVTAQLCDQIRRLRDIEPGIERLSRFVREMDGAAD